MDQRPKLRLVPVNGADFIQNQLTPEGDLKTLLASQSIEKRRNESREKMIRTALEGVAGLSFNAQNRLLQEFKSGGWGQMPHGLARRLKCPSRFGLKPIDVALIMTVYDATLAQVTPTLFAAISTAEFESATYIDERNIRRAQSELHERGALLKISVGKVNFWALNPFYFSLEAFDKDVAKLTRVKVTRVSAPCSKRVSSPRVNTGNFNQGESDLTFENKKENSSANNLSQESLKESHLSEFPEDMNVRWEKMSASGQETKTEKEREIFRRNHKAKGEAFFEKCGRVISFLEKHGSRKNGKYEAVHSPMVWIDGHWESNLERYEEWKRDQEKSQAKEAAKLEREARALAEKQASEEQDREHIEKLNEAAERFLDRYPDLDQIQEFVLEALGYFSDSTFRFQAFQKTGWTSPYVRDAVLDHFLKVESGERQTQIVPVVQE